MLSEEMRDIELEFYATQKERKLVERIVKGILNKFIFKVEQLEQREKELIKMLIKNIKEDLSSYCKVCSIRRLKKACYKHDEFCFIIKDIKQLEKTLNKKWEDIINEIK